MQWKPYDPRWLVELAGNACPEDPWLAEALAKCTRAAVASRAYTYFVDPANPNAPDSEWQFMESIILEHPTEGDLSLDILRGGRVGGVEFLKHV